MPGVDTLGGNAPFLDGAEDATYELDDERIGYLAKLIGRPVAHYQRFVERLSFVPTGGQRWERTLQIQLPDSERKTERWWIVPLGPFRRSRLPDISVVGEADEPLNLVTRKTHGQAMAKATLSRPLFKLGAIRQKFEDDDRARRRMSNFTDELADYFTAPITPGSGRTRNLNMSFVADHPRVIRAGEILAKYERLLRSIGVDEDDALDNTDALATPVVSAIDNTYYLCWVRARPGEAITLRSCHTIADPRHSLQPRSLRQLWRTFRGYLCNRDRKVRREKGVSLFRQFGLVPISYAFNIPTQAHTASYYSTIEPPEQTELTYLDWGVGNSIDEEKHGEVDCSQPSVHLYNDGHPAGSAPQKPLAIRTYLRCVPHHHKQILGAALVNIVIVWLLGEGRLPGQLGDPLQGLVIAAPSVVIAFLAQQQRHYYAQALRLTRAILWGYLFVAGVFLVAIAFSGQGGPLNDTDIGTKGTIAAWALAISSAAVFVWHFPLGQSYETAVRRRFDSKRKLMTEDDEPGLRWHRRRVREWRRRRRSNQGLVQEEGKPERAWEFYEAAYEQYARWIWRAVLASIVIAVLALRLAWDPSQGNESQKPAWHTKFVDPPALTKD